MVFLELEVHLKHSLESVVMSLDSVHVHATSVYVFNTPGKEVVDIPEEVAENILSVLILVVPGHCAPGIFRSIVTQLAINHVAIAF